VGCNPGKGAPSAPIFCYAEPPRCSKSGLTRNRHNHLKFLFTPLLKWRVWHANCWCTNVEVLPILACPQYQSNPHIHEWINCPNLIKSHGMHHENVIDTIQDANPSWSTSKCIRPTEFVLAFQLLRPKSWIQTLETHIHWTVSHRIYYNARSVPLRESCRFHKLWTPWTIPRYSTFYPMHPYCNYCDDTLFLYPKHVDTRYMSTGLARTFLIHYWAKAMLPSKLSLLHRTPQWLLWHSVRQQSAYISCRFLLVSWFSNGCIHSLSYWDRPQRRFSGIIPTLWTGGGEWKAS
jgi:hypothetical protein